MNFYSVSGDRDFSVPTSKIDTRTHARVRPKNKEDYPRLAFCIAKFLFTGFKITSMKIFYFKNWREALAESGLSDSEKKSFEITINW